jgi:hypothetical protein
LRKPNLGARKSLSHTFTAALLRRKSEVKLVIAAIARKLAVAVWYLMTGRWTPLEEIDNPRH